MQRKGILDKWTYKDARETYGIRYWGNGLFNISEQGEVTVLLHGNDCIKEVSLIEIIKGIKQRGLELPILLRFKDILEKRLQTIHGTFSETIKEYGYQGKYCGVYPIKVNQQEEVIREISNTGEKYHHGLEAGSKAEFIAALAYINDPEAYIICNGYKDREFIDLALYSLKMGIQTILVVERPGEIDLILKRAATLDVKPRIGIRIKLATKANGLWAESGGDSSVFGLTTKQIVDAIDFLRKKNKLDCLELLHFHLGSQITDIGYIRTATAEACRYYIELVNEGAKMGIVDIGGGLAVDYDGSQTNFASSKNYSIKEYCSDVIETIITGLKGTDIQHPLIITESGRAIVAYYSVLLFNILDVNRFEYKTTPKQIPADSHELLKNLFEIVNNISIKNMQEVLHDALYYRDEIRSLFLYGEISLRQRGLAEQLFWNIIKKVVNQSKNQKYIPEEIKELERILIDTYYGNFSLFQSLPDSWAIDQLFPVMPIHRLNEEPKNPAFIADVTCDCDGKINKFIDLHDIKFQLPLHDLNEDEDYIIGVFLVGAYQETLGDLHNLFGDTNVVSVSIDQAEEFEYTRELNGDSIADVLSYVEYEPRELLNRFRDTAERAVRQNKISPNERRRILSTYEKTLRSYTYLKSE